MRGLPTTGAPGPDRSGRLRRLAALGTAVIVIALATSGAVALADDDVPGDPGTAVATTVVDPAVPDAPPTADDPTTTTSVAPTTTTTATPTTSTEPPAPTEPPPTTLPPVTEPPATTVVTLPPWLIGRGLVGSCDGDDRDDRDDDRGHDAKGTGDDERCRPGALEPRPPSTTSPPTTPPTTEPPAPTTTATPPTTTAAGGAVVTPGAGSDDGDTEPPDTDTSPADGGDGPVAADPAPSAAPDGPAAPATPSGDATGTEAETAIAPFGNTPLVDGEERSAVDPITPLPPFADRLWSALPLGLAIGVALVGVALALVRIARLGTTP